MEVVQRMPVLKLMVLETTRRCNLRCIHCAVSEENTLGNYEAGDLPIGLFHKLLPMLEEFKPIVQLSGHGETLLHPNFLEMLEQVADAGCTPILQTNGTLLNARFAERIVQLGVDLMVVSIDGASPEVFEKIRRRAKLDKILNNIRLVNQAKQRLNKVTPHLGLEFVAFRQNIHELPEVIRMAGELGATHVQVAELHEFPLTRGESLVNDPLMTDWTERAEAEARKWDVKLTLPPHIPGREVARPEQDLVMIANAPSPQAEAPKPAPPPTPSYQGLRKTCREPWEKTSIQYNGDVWPCCVIDRSYGNLHTQSFEEIWNGPKYQALRASLLSDQPYQVCVDCPFYGWESAEPSGAEDHLEQLLDRLYSPDPREDARQIAAGRRKLRETCLTLLESDAPSDPVFVERLYRRVLDRPPDNIGFHGWKQALHSGMSRAAVLSKFLSSNEFNKLLAPYVNPTIPPYHPGTDLRFGAGGEGVRYTVEGWSRAEDWGVWTDGPAARLRIPLAQPLGPRSFLTIHAGAYLPPKRPSFHVRVLCEGETLGEWPVRRPDPIFRSLRIPDSLIGRPELTLALHVDDPACPAHHGNGSDHRLLGLGVRALRIGPRSVKEVCRGVYASLFNR